MLRKRLALVALACTIAVLITSCSQEKVGSLSGASSAAEVYESQVAQASSEDQPDFTASVVKEAKIYDSSPGRIALSMLICRLDSSRVYTDLVKKNAKELFNILSETAFEKDITLESLDNIYGLTDILASEDIYVSIKANSVTSLPQPSSSSPTAVSIKEVSSNSSGELSSSENQDAEKGGSSSEEESSSGKSSQAGSESEKAPWIDKFQDAILQPVKK